MLRFVTQWFVVFGAPHTQNVFINYTCSRADALLCSTVLGHVCFLFNFTPDRARPEHKCCSLPLLAFYYSHADITVTATISPQTWSDTLHCQSDSSMTCRKQHPTAQTNVSVIWSGNRRRCWENWHKIFFVLDLIMCNICALSVDLQLFVLWICAFIFFTWIAVTPVNKRPHSPLHRCLPQPWFKTYE